jgi:hypothetical protein
MATAKEIPLIEDPLTASTIEGLEEAERTNRTRLALVYLNRKHWKEALDIIAGFADEQVISGAGETRILQRAENVLHRAPNGLRTDILVPHADAEDGVVRIPHRKLIMITLLGSLRAMAGEGFDPSIQQFYMTPDVVDILERNVSTLDALYLAKHSRLRSDQEAETIKGFAQFRDGIETIYKDSPAMLIQETKLFISTLKVLEATVDAHE